MKFIWIGLTLLLLVAQPTKAGTPPFIIRNCVNHTQVSAVDLGLFFGTDFMVISTPVKCYFNCLFESSGLIIDGKINKEMVQMVSNGTEAAKFNRVIEICDNMDPSDVCEAGFQFFKCFIAYENEVKNKKL